MVSCTHKSIFFGVIRFITSFSLNAPHIAEGYNFLLRAIRSNNSLPDDVRELVVSVLVTRNHTDTFLYSYWVIFRFFELLPLIPQVTNGFSFSIYNEFLEIIGSNFRMAHEPIGRAAGLSSADLATVREVSNVSLGEVRLEHAPPLSQLHSAALLYTDHMTKSIKVPQDVFDNLRSLLLNDQQMLEITVTIAAYNMVSRILVSLDVSDKAESPVPEISIST